MSMDFERDRSDNPTTGQESPLFPARPIWEQRGRKRRVFGGPKTAADPAATVSPEPRTFAADRDDEEPMALDTPIDPHSGDYPRASPAEVRESAAAAAVADSDAPSPTASSATFGPGAGMVAPIGSTPSRAGRAPRSKGVGPAAIAAGIVALGAIGAAGWYASRDNDGIPELAPGQTSKAQVAAAPLPPADLPPSPPVADTAVNPPPAATAPTATVRPARPERMASSPRTRPAAAAASAGDTGVNASTTTLPGEPQPYSTLNPGATPPPANPAPTQAAPSPGEAPAPAPATPPTLPSETATTPDPAAGTTEPPQ